MSQIICISRGTKSGGQGLAARLAEKLDYACLSREELIEAATGEGIQVGRLEMAMMKRGIFSEQLALERDHYLAFTTAYLCEPADPCDPVTTDPAISGCEDGEGCYVAAVGAGLTFCEPEGSTAPEDYCDDDFDCIQGYTCFGGGPKSCRKLCRADTDTDCPTEQTCGPLNDVFGICF